MEKVLLPAKIIRVILSRIAMGAYPRGQRLPAERKLCQEFGISRGTLRRALADLEKMGAVKIKAQSGVYAEKLPKPGAAHPVLPNTIAQTTLDIQRQ